ncbi:MAG: hypothetical protein L6R41_007053 [Letrouitia leprolyta]|nr:MAG: hypothetical protein L6R41_007053 [Letrouitia leprolyta]
MIISSSLSPVVPYPGLFPAPPGVQPDFVNPEKHTGGAVSLSCVFVTLSTLFLILRLYTKLRLVKTFGWDDVVITTAWLCTLIVTGLYLRTFAYGAGVDIWNVRIDDFPIYFKVHDIFIASFLILDVNHWLTLLELNIITSLFGVPANGLPKIAILLYYLRINPAKWFRYSTIAALVLNALWIVIYMCAFGLSCNPVKKVYDTKVSGKCMDLVPWYTSASIGNPILDLIVIVIPIPMVIHLHANFQTKLVLASIFFVSSCTIIVSLLRIPATFVLDDTRNVTRDFIRAINLAIVEYNLSVVCGSALVLRPFYRHHLAWLFGTSRPSDRAEASPGHEVDGPSDPRLNKNYRNNISTIGGSSPNPTRRRGWWDGLGDTFFTNDDEDLDNLRHIDTTDNKHRTMEREMVVDDDSAAEVEKQSDFQHVENDVTRTETRS